MSEEPATYTTGRAIAESQVNDQLRKVPYRPDVNAKIGHVTSTILLQQIYFWWKVNGERAFYKFQSPCSHDLYKEGDSWDEELGFGPSEFITARKKIATKITRGTSKTKVLDQDKLTSLVIYWTDSGRVTWYEINKDLYHKLIGESYQTKSKYPIRRSKDYLEAGVGSIPIPEITSEITLDTHSEVSADPSPSGDAVQPALIQAIPVAEKKESDHQGEDPKKTLELVLIDHFVEASRIERPVRRVKGDYSADQTRWRKPVQVIAELVDWDTREAVRLLDATLERLLGGALTVSSPLSLVETARSIKGEWARGQPARVNGHAPAQVSVGGGQRWG